MKYPAPFNPANGTIYPIILDFFNLVGLAGLEPATFRPPDGRATRLRHSPPLMFFLVIFSGRASEKDQI